MQNRVDAPESYFTIPQCSNFLDNNFVLQLTPESKELFSLGERGQGYIGLVDLETGDVHLVPSFNKNDGLLRLDKNGTPFRDKDKRERYAESSQALGTMTGDLHTQCTSILKLGDRGGINGKLMGFGVWKAGCSVKFLSELPGHSALIPDEYLLIRENNQWELVYVDEKKDVKPVQIDVVPHLREELNKLGNKAPELLSKDDRKPIELLLQGNEKAGLKLIKNRSSSQNFYSVKYDEMYTDYFRYRVVNQQVHTLNSKREIPLPVFEKIMDAVCAGLGLPKLYDLSTNPLVPDGNDNLQLHLKIQEEWVTDPDASKQFLFHDMAEEDNKLSQDNNIRKMLQYVDSDAEILEDTNNFNAFANVIKKSPILAYEICLTFKVVAETNIFEENINFEFFLDLYRNMPYTFDVGFVICSLVDYELVNEHNFIHMIESVGNLDDDIITRIIYLLDDLNLTDNHKNRMLFSYLLTHKDQVEEVAYALNKLNTIQILKTNNLFEELLPIVIDNADYAEKISSLLDQLNKISFLTQQNAETMVCLTLQNLDFLEEIEEFVFTINRYRPMKKDLNSELLVSLAGNAACFSELNSTIDTLYTLNILRDDENFEPLIKLLANNSAKMNLIGIAFELLKQCNLLTKKSMSLFIERIQQDVTYAEKISNVLSVANPDSISHAAQTASNARAILHFVDGLINKNKSLWQSQSSPIASQSIFAPTMDAQSNSVRAWLRFSH